MKNKDKNYPSITIIKTEEKDNGLHIQAVPNQHPDACPKCSGTALYEHGSNTRTFMDIPYHGKHVFIILERKRYQCRNCEKTFFQSCSDMNDSRKTTSRLIKYIEQSAMRRACTGVADDVGITEGTVRNILNSYIERLEAEHVFETPKILGIDEVKINRIPRLVLTNIEEKTIIDLVDNRNQQTITSGLSRLKNKEKLELVIMGMWQLYRDAINSAFPCAVVIIDKQYIVKAANNVIDSSWKGLCGQMTTDQINKLKKDSHLMLRLRRNLNNTQELTLLNLVHDHPALAELYYAKERLLEIWNSDTTKPDAESAYQSWKDSVPLETFVYFSEFDKLITSWHKEVFGYFDHSVSNDLTESIGNQMKAIIEKGSGYSFNTLRAMTLFEPGAHKNTIDPDFGG